MFNVGLEMGHLSLSSDQWKEWDATWGDILDHCFEDSSCYSYSGAVKNYLTWCDRKDAPTTAPESYCSWLWERVRYSSPGSYSKNTVESWRSAISHHFKGSSSNPTQSEIASVTMQAVKKFCRDPSQKQELKKSDLKRIVDELRLRALSSDGTKRKFVHARNALMLLVAFRTLFRCAELVSVESSEMFVEQLEAFDDEPVANCLMIVITQRKTVQQKKRPVQWFHYYVWLKQELKIERSKRFFCSATGEDLSPKSHAHIVKDCVGEYRFGPQTLRGSLF